VRPEVQVLDDPTTAAAERLAAAASGGGHVALAGGSTPRAAYEHAATLDADWSQATIWFGDDRCVPPDHEHSNYRMAKEALLDRLEVRGGPAVMRIEGERGPEEAAHLYERELQSASDAGTPRLDLVLLGLGPDAHTASLFPNDAALGEREHLAVGVETPGMPPLVSRVTLTLPLVNCARAVVFLVAGEDKADAVARAFSGVADPGAPASLVRPESSDLVLLADPAATARLEAAG
jgi:6-phosphogluconolactonase